MKFLFDNNLSPHLAAGVAGLSNYDGRVTQVVSLRGKFRMNTPDEVWLPELVREGGWLIISIDQFRKSVAERELVREHGLTVFVLDRQWSEKQYWDMAARFIEWWPTILEVAARTSRAAYRVPYRR